MDPNFKGQLSKYFQNSSFLRNCWAGCRTGAGEELHALPVSFRLFSGITTFSKAILSLNHFFKIKLIFFLIKKKKLLIKYFPPLPAIMPLPPFSTHFFCPPCAPHPPSSSYLSLNIPGNIRSLLKTAVKFWYWSLWQSPGSTYFIKHRITILLRNLIKCLQRKTIDIIIFFHVSLKRKWIFLWFKKGVKISS